MKKTLQPPFLHCMLIPFVQKATRFIHTVQFLSNIINQCLLCKSPSNSLKSLHAHLIKLGFNTNTFLTNKCIDLYIKTGCTKDALKAFHELPDKNIVSWNLFLKILVKCDIGTARQVFDKMPERDCVSWNTIISGYVSSGNFDHAWDVFLCMKESCVRPSEYTFSIMLSCVKCASYVKEMHCYMIRNGVDKFSLVVWNSILDSYGKTGLVEYAIAVFFDMDRVDVISWNSLISVCCQSSYERFGLQQFFMMKRLGYEPDEYTLSAIINACSNLRNLEKGRQIFCYCVKKVGLLCNSIVSSAAIGMFSKCKRVQDAVSVFQHFCVLDSASVNTMIACYASNKLEENALQLFVLSLRESIRPTEFTMSCVLSSSAVYVAMELSVQIHSVIIKSGFEWDEVVASSLVEAYCKHGFIELAISVFDSMNVKDLISCNTMLHGLIHHGKIVDSICLFHKLLDSGLHPDQITFSAVLTACSYGGFVEKGMAFFSSMINRYGVRPINQHYACVAVMMAQAGNVEEAINLLQEMKIEPDVHTCESILGACGVYKDWESIERVAQRMIEMGARSLLPYMILTDAYEKEGRWERVVRVKREIKKMATTEENECSLINIKNHVFSFEGSQIVHHCGNDVYKVLDLLAYEILDGMDTRII